MGGEVRAHAWQRGAWVIPLLLAVAAYWPAPGSERVWDDSIVIDQQLSAFHSVRDVFRPAADIPQFSPTYYRPVVVLSYLLDRSLYGAAVTAGMHVSNILMHALVTLLVLRLSRGLLGARPGAASGALVAACIFAVHPIHTESVSWISGRSDVLASLFVLLGVQGALLWRDRGSPAGLLLAVATCLAGLLAKEVALAVLILVPAVLLLGDRPAAGAPRGRSGTALWLPLAAGYGVATGAYFYLRQTGGVTLGGALDLGLADQAGRLVRSLGYYGIKVWWPWPQSHFVTWQMAPALRTGALILLAGCAALALSIRAWRRSGNALPLLCLVWFGASLGPSLAIAVRAIAETPVAERYLYLPSVAMALAAGALFAWAWHSPRPGLRWPAGLMLALVLPGYGAGTVARGLVWSNNLRLWEDATAKAGSEGLPWLELGLAHFDKGEVEAAEQAWQRALAANNDAEGRAFALNNLGMAALGRDTFEEAETLFWQALAQQPAYPAPYFGLGSAAEMRAVALAGAEASPTNRRRLLAQAEGHYRSAIRLNPNYYKAHYSLARLLGRQGRDSELGGNPAEAARLYAAALEELGRVSRFAEAAASEPPLDQVRAAVEERLAAVRASGRQETRR